MRDREKRRTRNTGHHLPHGAFFSRRPLRPWALRRHTPQHPAAARPGRVLWHSLCWSPLHLTSAWSNLLTYDLVRSVLVRSRLLLYPWPLFLGRAFSRCCCSSMYDSLFHTGIPRPWVGLSAMLNLWGAGPACIPG